MSAQAFDNFSLLLQIQQATRGMAQSMIVNANTHIAMANAQSPNLATLQGYVNAVAANYAAIVAQGTTFTTANQVQMTAACAIIGATLTDLGNYSAPLTSAITALKNADKSSYAAIITSCQALLATVPIPATIFGN